MGSTVLQAGPAQFGWDFAKHGGVRNFTAPVCVIVVDTVVSSEVKLFSCLCHWQVRGQLAEASPLQACQSLADDTMNGKIGVTERGGCMFVEKVCDLLVSVLFLLVSL